MSEKKNSNDLLPFHQADAAAAAAVSAAETETETKKRILMDPEVVDCVMVRGTELDC